MAIPGVGNGEKMNGGDGSQTKTTSLEEYIDLIVNVVTNDGRNIIGILRGFDQATNLVMEACQERVFSRSGVEQVVLGVYVIRGDNVAIVGELDEDTDLSIDYHNVKADPLKPVVH